MNDERGREVANIDESTSNVQRSTSNIQRGRGIPGAHIVSTWCAEAHPTATTGDMSGKCITRTEGEACLAATGAGGRGGDGDLGRIFSRGVVGSSDKGREM